MKEVARLKGLHLLTEDLDHAPDRRLVVTGAVDRTLVFTRREAAELRDAITAWLDDQPAADAPQEDRDRA